MNRVKSKVCVVTGGSMGIGEAACRLLALEGGRVAVTDVKDEAGTRVAAAIRDGGGEAEYWHLDVSDEAQVKARMNEVNAHFGRIDVLVNNAGISGKSKPTHQITEAEWDEVMKVNVKGVFFCTKHVIPYMQRAGGGSIINLSSIYGIISAQDVPPYHASKGAVRIMSKTDAVIYAKDGIRVNSVHPGFIWTPMVEAFGKAQPGGLEEFKKHLDSLHPLGHAGEPDDIAYGILYLASAESKFMTGAELVIDGGYTAR